MEGAERMTLREMKQLQRAIVTRLVELQGEIDYIKAHKEADTLLCRMLSELGYPDVVDAYEQITEKGYD